MDSNGDGSEKVKLDGSASNDPDGGIANFTWTENGTQVATGAKSGVILTVGTHTITLAVTDNRGMSATDTIVITINPKS